MSFKNFINRKFGNILYLTKNYNVLYGSINQKRMFNSTKQKPTSTLKLSLIGASVGALVGTGYSLTQLNKPNNHILNGEITIPILKTVPEITPSRKVS